MVGLNLSYLTNTVQILQLKYKNVHAWTKIKIVVYLFSRKITGQVNSKYCTKVQI